MGDCLQKFKDEFEQVTSDYGLSERRKQNHIRNILWNDAQRFYVDHVKGYESNFEHTISLIDFKYNSVVGQNRIINTLMD